MKEEVHKNKKLTELILISLQQNKIYDMITIIIF